MGAPMADARDEPAPPAIDCPVLIGVDQIAAWLRISEGRCRGMIADGTVPTFRWPNRSVRCALKSAINAAVLEYASRPGAAAKSPARNPKTPK
jgi:hypothetical protein